MVIELLEPAGASWFRGNLHCHSNRSDGEASPEVVAAAYRDAGYHFIVLSDHFEAEYGWRVTDTREFRDDGFTTIPGAELSSGNWEDRACYWITAAGLPLDFAPPPPNNHAEAITRARDCGAFVTLLHPGLNNLPLAGVTDLPGFSAIHAVELYNHNLATGAGTDRANGAYLLDGLLEQGHRLLLNAGDDAHFHRSTDRFGGWVEVLSPELTPESLLEALKAGRYFSTQGPRLESLRIDRDRLYVRTNEVATIAVTGSGAQWQDGSEHIAAPHPSMTEAEFDLTPFHGSYCRVIAIDHAGKCAWSNPIWP
jgi:hypothetical protein